MTEQAHEPSAGPVRIQRRRTKGWRMPEGVVYVGRPSRWQNPFLASEAGTASAVERFRLYAESTRHLDPTWLAPLRGRNLACWCGAGPCHADVLLEMANSPPA